ncbi:hypothetical protein K1T71_012323 [Dendrolimus kikuchii]|uniref:Uncharacterized protein n=1 Tax=Dendrolimus kikuchii TaxID=765133 RepID=A0ACC1CLA8_9NEOP|nr:hypothetical protein K1T71_012323 [Dendrolimus kikuchii]
MLSPMLFLSVACSLPKIIVNVYHFLLFLEDHESYGSIGFIVMHTFQICFLLFTPFVLVELYTMEIEKIRMFLMHRLIDENNPAIRDDVDLFFRYVNTRSMKYKIFRIIPVNMTLPLELINLCITYVIVIINFTHLYG